MNFWRLQYLGVADHPNLELVSHDLTDTSSAIRLLDYAKPDEVYNLAAQSFVDISFQQPQTTAEITGIGLLNMLEAVRIVDRSIRFYQASTSELFGKVQAIPQDENTPFYPRSPYACAKLFAHWSVINYRESYDIFASSGILFNHESPLRGIEFVTRKITSKIAKMVLTDDTTPLQLGNIDAKRDWGFAAEYVAGMHKILQHDNADTFVLATNQTNTVRKFAELAFAVVDIPIEWQGVAENEKGYHAKSGQLLVQINPKLYRPAEVDILIGDYSKAQRCLGWQPSTSLQQLCKIMVEGDLQKQRDGKILM